jgi:SfnB family sulfur acquisition oxidoreductase
MPPSHLANDSETAVLTPRLRSSEEATAAAAAYAASIGPGAADRDRAGKVPYAELAELDRSGLLAITIPHSHDGPDLPATTLADVVRIIAAVDPAIAQVPQGHFLFVDIIRLWGSPAARQRIFADVLDGNRLGNALAERGNLHAQDLRTRLSHATGGSDGLRLDGRKYYCTGAISSRWLPVSAIDDEGRLSVAIVDRHADGVHIDDDWAAMGQRATVSGTSTFEDVAVDPHLVIDYWRAFERPQLIGARAQLFHAAIEVGIAEGALADAGEFVRTRARPFFEAVRGGWAEKAADDPHTVLRFGRLTTQVTAARQLLHWAAQTLDEIGLEPADPETAGRASLAVAQAKAFASETAVLVASDLFALTGTSGTDRRWDFDRHWRNARTHSVHDPVDWKYHHIGAFELLGTLPPNHGQL